MFLVKNFLKASETAISHKIAAWRENQKGIIPKYKISMT